MKTTTGWKILAAVMLAGVLAASSAMAGKPAPPPPPPGKIFASAGDEAGVLHFYKMNTDGTGRVMLPANVTGEPSRYKHGGYYWFLSLRQVAGEVECDGSPRWDLFAVREDGNEDFTVRLTDGTTGWGMEFDPYGIGKSHGSARWRSGDSEISFYASRREPVTCAYLEAGILVASIFFDGSGNVTGLPGMPATSLVPVPLVLYQPPGSPPPPPYWFPDWDVTYRYAWSPDNTKVAYTTLAEGLRVHTVATGQSVIIVTDGRGADWSPTGARIAYTTSVPGQGLRSATCNPDGSGVHVYPMDAQKSLVAWPLWNTTGSHLIHGRGLPSCKVCANYYLMQKDMNVWRTTATFTEGKDLTPDLDLMIVPEAWVNDSAAP